MIIKSLMDKIFNNESVAQDDTLDEILTFNKKILHKERKKLIQSLMKSQVKVRGNTSKNIMKCSKKMKEKKLTKIIWLQNRNFIKIV